ncbi:hypothetical protein GP486_001829 [Trichoglossum hirsutum]|uniref:Adenosine kinase n=1 Tax=Trichoglossum hirsutum TaxID=265104 RepID=A0A9P8LGD4_9PEZI|nr:hypothetical protein GP486_001829 [Trichoglossum hirsutum]
MSKPPTTSDIQAVGNVKLLEKYGLNANDAILAEEKHKGLYEDLLNNYDAKLIAGGAAQNTARGAQYILPASSVLYIGCVGQDKYAEILRAAVDREGVHAEYRVDASQPTGRCGVIITDHNRSMCTDLAAANHYKLDHMKQPEIWELVEAASVYYVGGYHLTVCVPAIMALAEKAAEANKVWEEPSHPSLSPFIASCHNQLTPLPSGRQIFALSLSAPFIPQFFKDQLDGTAPYWDYVVGNETEALAYAQAHNLNTTSIPVIARHLADLPKKNTLRRRTAIITQGTDPTIVAVGGEDGVRSFPVRGVGKSEINDTNGAGDAFAGGLLAGIVEGKGLELSVDMGHWLASLSIRELGPS